MTELVQIAQRPTESTKRQHSNCPIKNIDFVKYPSKVPWCSDFLYESLRTYSTNNMRSLHPEKIGKTAPADITHLVNVQLLNKIHPLFGKRLLEKLYKKSKIIAGVRGEFGLTALKKWSKYVDLVLVNVDSSLIQKTEAISQDVTVIGEGADPKIFYPSEKKPVEFKIAWMGRDHKPFKNAQYLPLLGSPVLKASYEHYIPHLKVADMLRESSVLVNLSESEGFCRPVLEAAMCGLPAVSHDVGIASKILDPEFVLSFSPRVDLKPYLEILNYLKEDPDEAWRVGHRNYERSQNYTWKNLSRQYDAIYEEIVS